MSARAGKKGHSTSISVEKEAYVALGPIIRKSYYIPAGLSLHTCILEKDNTSSFYRCFREQSTALCGLAAISSCKKR